MRNGKSTIDTSIDLLILHHPQATEIKSMPSYLKLKIAYDGSRFNGFQRQMTNLSMIERPSKRPHWSTNGTKKQVSVTIQECIEDAIVNYSNHMVPEEPSTVTDIKLKFAGRTDKGVHARGQVVTVCLPKLVEGLDEIKRGINSRLPMDISVDDVESLGEDENLVLDPRRDVTMKTYSYTVKYRRKVMVEDADGKDVVAPFCQLGVYSFRHALDSPCLWLCPWALDDSRLNELCEQLQGEHDYRAFVHKQTRDDQSQILTIQRMSVTTQELTNEMAPVVVARFELEAKGFRRTMVRNLVGYCVDVCRGLGTVVELDWESIWSGSDAVADRINAAPASGLCLECVLY